MSLWLAAILALAAGRPVVREVVLEPDAPRPTLTVAASGALAMPEIGRKDDRLTLTWDADLAPGTVLPGPHPPLRAVRLEPRAGRLVLEMTIDSAVPHQVEVMGEKVRVTFGAQPQPSRDVAALWTSLFPAPAEPEVVPEAAPAESAPAPGAGSEDRAPQDGVQLGPVLLQPALEAVFVSADSTFVSPEPVRDDYFELRPKIAALAGLRAGTLSADYEARWRRASSFDNVRDTTHLVNAGLEVPVGPRLTLRASDHFARGTLETREVDPGGEYFFGLGPFRRNRVGLQGRLQTSGRLRAEMASFWEDIQVDDSANFFDYGRRTLEGRVAYELGPRLTAALALSRERIPPPIERPLVDTTARALAVELFGDLGPLTTGTATLGLRDQDTPLAGEGGRAFRGLVLAARVRRELGPEATLELAGSRASFPSAFEDDAFYLSSAASAELALPAPAALVVRLATGYHWNDYRTLAAERPEPRRDRIWEGSIGLARPLTRRAWVRADYRRERRNSNLDSFEVTTQAFTLQVGLGFLGAPGR
jgi:hypothetical protein